MKNYIEKDVKNIWSFEKYADHYDNTQWSWRYYPFSNNLDNVDDFQFNVDKNFKDISILEIGSSMGKGYSFLKNKKNIDVSNFVGIDVSRVAHQYCLTKYPETKWLNENFSEYELKTKFDYSYERHSIHHMPYPLKQFEKVLKNTNIAFSSTFRGCIHGPTISDLDLAYFKEDTGKYFMNIINFTEVIFLALNNGFNDIVLDWRGLHEDIPSSHNDQAGMYACKSIDRDKTLISRFIIYCRKNPNMKKVKIHLKRKLIYSFRNFMIIRKLVDQVSKIEKIYNFKNGL